MLLAPLEDAVLFFQIRPKTAFPLAQGNNLATPLIGSVFFYEKTRFMFNRGGIVHEQETVRQFETLIMDWSKLIHEVLDRSSLQALDDGLDPGPEHEIEFWESRETDLQSIYNQMTNPAVEHLAAKLDAVGSSYLNTFKVCLTSVMNGELGEEVGRLVTSRWRDMNNYCCWRPTAMQEASQLSRYLRPLADRLVDVDEGDFGEKSSTLRPLFITLAHIWKHCAHYRAPARFSGLLRKIGNQYIESVSTSATVSRC